MCTTEYLPSKICTVLNLRAVDLNLLPVLEAVYEERSLSRAAERLAMTQSAVSHAVARLRVLFRDELFVRQARGVLPTPAAADVYSRLRGALVLVREAVTDRRGFDPRTSERRFFVTIPHPLGPMIALRLQERLAKIAPGISVAASTRSRPVELVRALRDGRIDAALDWLPIGGEQFKEEVLFRDTLIAMARNGHPALRRPPSSHVLKAGAFVQLRPRVEGEHPLEGIREWQRLRLRTALEVSEILEIFMVVNHSDLFGLIPKSMEAVARETFGLRALGWAPKTASIPIRLIWHASRNDDPAHAFLRAELGRVAKAIVHRG
jgi:LysR family transcriptional regulator, transcriptional activator for leuABCD operon